jgi:hypothetical protein
MRQDPASMSDEALLAALGRSNPSAPRAAPAAPVNPQAMSDAELMRALGRAAPAAPQRAPAAGGGRQPARPQAAPAAPADDYDTPMIRRAQSTTEGVTYTMIPLAPEDTPESLTERGFRLNPETNNWELPRELEGIDVRAPALEALPMVRPGAAAPAQPQGSLLDQAVAGARRNPVLGTIMGLAVGGAAGVNDIFGNAMRYGGNAMSYIPGMGDLGRGISQNANEFLAATNQRVDAERANAGLGGSVETARLASQMVAPMGALNKAGQVITQGGRAISAAAPALRGAGESVARIGRALPAGGILPRAVPAGAAAPSRLAQAGYLAENVAAGALSGGAQAALVSPEDGVTGAVIGALVPIAARPAAAAVGVVTDLWRKASGTYGEANAARIVRQALGVDYEVALAALRNAPEGVTAQQALADAGVPADVFMAVGEAGRAADPRPYRILADQQDLVRQARLTPAQGAVQAAEMSGDEALRAAQAQRLGITQTGEQLVNEALTNQRAIPREGAAALEDLRVGAEEAAGFYSASLAQARRAIDEMAGGTNLTAARTSEAAAKQALRDATAPMRAELLAAADASGALDIAPISARLMQMADAPGVSPTNRPVLARVAAELDAMAARRGGTASAEDVYAFRKDLQSVVAKALNEGGGDMPSSAAQRAIVVRDAQLLIDKQLEDAIRAAGGPEWQAYLDTYSAGMRALERQEMMGVAGWMLRQNPASFQNLLRGESPDAVAGIFGRGRIDLADTLEPDQLAALKNAASVLDQEADIAGRFTSQTAETTRGTARAKTDADIALEAARARAAQEAASANTMVGNVEAQNAMAIARAQGELSAVEGINAGELTRDQRIRTMAAQGATAARELLSPGRAMFRRTRTGAAFGNPGMGLALDLGSALLDAKVSRQTRTALARAYVSGASMADLIALTPAADRGPVMRILSDPRFYGAASRGVVPPVAGMVNNMFDGEPANAMSPPPQ